MTIKSKATIYQTKLQRVEASIERTQRRINRNHNAMIRLLRQRKRLLVTLKGAEPEDLEDRLYVKPVELAKPPKPADEATAALQMLKEREDRLYVKPDDPLDARNQPWNQRGNPADEKAKAEIIASQQARAKVKAKASGEKSRAKKRGELRKIPLVGKAALAAIREGK